jgi:predicted dehydrogenase
MTRIAFLSTAHIHTKSFLENLTKAGDGRCCVAVWDDVADRGKRYAAGCGARFEADLSSILGAADVDGFAICAENTRHTALLERVLPVGKPVFCEKPLVTTAADAATVARLVSKHRTPLVCGWFQHSSASMRTVVRLIEAGTFGTVTRVRYRNAHHAAYGRWFDSPDLAWFADPTLGGGGAMMDMGAHAVHLLRDLFGRVDSVQAVLGNHAGTYPQTDDWGIATLRFASGVVGTVEAAWTQTGGIGGLEITGSKASLWNTPEGYVFGGPGLKTEKLVESAFSRPDRMDRLVALVRGELAPAELAADLAASLDEAAIMDAIYSANRSGAWAEVARLPAIV